MKMLLVNGEYIIEHSKSIKHRKINPITGTRFKKITIQQFAFDTLIKCIESGDTYYPQLCKRFNTKEL